MSTRENIRLIARAPLYICIVLYVLFTVFLLCSRGPLGRMAYELKV